MGIQLQWIIQNDQAKPSVKGSEFSRLPWSGLLSTEAELLTQGFFYAPRKVRPQGQEQRILDEKTNAAKSGYFKGQNSPDPGGSPPIVYPTRTDKRLELLVFKRVVKKRAFVHCYGFLYFKIKSVWQ